METPPASGPSLGFEIIVGIGIGVLCGVGVGAIAGIIDLVGLSCLRHRCPSPISLETIFGLMYGIFFGAILGVVCGLINKGWRSGIAIGLPSAAFVIWFLWYPHAHYNQPYGWELVFTGLIWLAGTLLISIATKAIYEKIRSRLYGNPPVDA